MYHHACNIYGWQRRAQYECREHYGYPDYDDKIRQKLQHFRENLAGNMDQTEGAGKEYCAVNNAEFVPEIANDFVMDYIKEDKEWNKLGLERQVFINLTQHLCHWLFVNHLTCSKICLMPDQVQSMQ